MSSKLLKVLPQQLVQGQRQSLQRRLKMIKDHHCSIEIQKVRRGFDGLVVLHIEQRTGSSVTQGPTLKDLRGRFVFVGTFLRQDRPYEGFRV